MKDFLGNELKIGDIVIMLPTMCNVLVPEGIIVSITNKVRVLYDTVTYRSPSHLLIKIPLTS